MYSFCWTPVALKNAIVTSQITYSSFMPQHCICIICYTWWISKNIHKNFYTSSEKEEHRPWSSSCEKKRKKSTKIHQNPPKSTPAWKNLPNKKTGTLMWDFKKEVLSDSARASTLVLHGTHQHWVVESSAEKYSTQMRQIIHQISLSIYKHIIFGVWPLSYNMTV